MVESAPPVTDLTASVATTAVARVSISSATITVSSAPLIPYTTATVIEAPSGPAAASCEFATATSTKALLVVVKAEHFSRRDERKLDIYTDYPEHGDAQRDQTIVVTAV